MNEKIKNYVEDRFRNAPQKRRILEIKEELLSDMNEKYSDLVSQGKTEDEAYLDVISGIGDIDSLIDDVAEMERQSFTGAAGRNAGFFRRPKYVREDDSFVEGYKEKMTMNDKNSRMLGAVSSSMWTFIVLIYICISFYSWQWHITWIIFPVGAVIQQVIYAVMRGKINAGGIIWTSAVVIYLVVTFATWQWAYTWIIFLGAIVVQQVYRAYSVWRSV